MALNNFKIEQVILQILNTDQPIGSGTLGAKLQENGVEVSEATAGRILRDLDLRGLTEKVGYRGRTITSKGKKHLEELKKLNQKQQVSQKFTEVLKSNNKKDLIDILIARRGIERETAQLAAKNATEEQLKEISSVIEKHDMHPFDRVGRDSDVRFHSLIAEASGNPVLKTALELLRQEGQLSPVLAYIRKNVGSQVVKDHKKLFMALKSRDSKAAETAMIEHIENLIEDVKMYWEVVRQHNDDIQ